MKKGILIASVALATSFAACTNKASVKNVELTNEADSISYALGNYMGAQVGGIDKAFNGIDKDAYALAFNNATANANTLSQFEATFGEIDTVIFNAGFVNALLEDTTYFATPQAAEMYMSAYSQKAKSAQDAERQMKGQANIAAGKKFLEENKTKEGVKTTASGLQYKIIKKGTGEKPTAESRVKCHYTGKLLDGTVFDSSVERGEPATFPVNGVIAGWQEALPMMPVGSKWELYVPAELAYGAQGAGQDIAPNATLIFEVELLSIEN